MPRGKYDRQLIVGLLEDAADAVTVQQSTDLDAKHRDEPLPSEVVFVPPNTAMHGASPDDACPITLRQALRGELQVPQCVSRQSRLYLVGRGDWRARSQGVYLSYPCPRAFRPQIGDTLPLSYFSSIKVV